MKRKLIFLGLLTFLGLSGALGYAGSLALQSDPGIEGFMPANWPEHCQQMRTEVSKDSGNDVTYQPRPNTIDIQSIWEMNWHGLRVPIPAIAFSDVFFLPNNSENSQHSIALLKGTIKGEQVTLVLGRDREFEPLTDLFSTSSLESDSAENQTSSKGLALTKELFGDPPVPLTDLFDLGYRHTPKDLSCLRDRRKLEIPIALALVIKSVSGNLDEAYEINQGSLTRSSWIDSEKGGARERWSARWSNNIDFSDVTITLPKGSSYSEIGLGIGQSNWTAQNDAPEWLGALERAIATPNRNKLLALSSALKDAGMSEKSVQRAKEYAEKAPN